MARGGDASFFSTKYQNTDRADVPTHEKRVNKEGVWDRAGEKANHTVNLRVCWELMAGKRSAVVVVLACLTAPCALAWTPAPKLPLGRTPVAAPVGLQQSRARPAVVLPQIHMRLSGGGGGFDFRGLVGPIVFGSLLASGALGWIFNGLLFLSFLPLVLGPLYSWYVENNLLEGTCPECGSPVQVLKGQRGQCFYCGSTFSSELSASGVFIREGSAPTRPREDGVVEVEVLTDDD